MGFTEDFLAAEEKRKKKKKTGDSYTDEFLAAEERRGTSEDYDPAPVAPIKTLKDIAPVKKDERKWFQKGLFEDGYQFGDVSKTIWASTSDLRENIGAGLAEMPEKILDGLLTVAPYIAQGQYYANGGGYNIQADQAFNQAIETGKKGNAEIVAKDLYDGEKVAKAILTDYNPVSYKNITGGDVEADSVFGEKTDALAQSGGQLLGTAALQAAGVPWWLTTGATSLGSESENALNSGATLEEAAMSGLIAAGAEILTEKISGGISFGGKTWDEGMEILLASNISNKVVRTLAKLGIDAAGEGGEEILSGVMSAIGQKLTYRSEEEVFGENGIFSSEEAFESFIGGAVLGGGSSAVSAVQSTIKGEDAVTGLKKYTEQKVVDKLYKDAVAKEEADGKKLTAKEKTDLYNGVLNNLEKGYIPIDTIEEVLGYNDYKVYQDTVSNEDALIKELGELRNMKSGDMTDIQKDRLAELKGMNLTDTTKRDGLKKTLSDNVFAKVKDTKLVESYNEQVRRTQAFEADLSKYDSKQAAIVQKAIDSGILNNTNRTHDFVDMVSKISADKGVLFDFANNARLKESGFAMNGKTINGFVTKDGVTLNIDAAKSLNTVVGHEITHVLEGTELYTELSKAITEYAKSKGDYQGRYDTLAELYKDVKDADIDKELTSDLVGDYLFTDQDFVNSLSTEHRNIFEKIYDEIKYLCKVATAGSKEARELEKVKHAFEQAYKADSKASGETKYSLGYHAGDLGKAESYGQQGYYRDTGHFGTGTYFVGDEAKISDSHYGKRPHHAVEFDNYNLYKIRNDNDGTKLHKSLKAIDGGITQEFVDAAKADEFRVSNLRHEANERTENYSVEEYDEDLGFFVPSNYTEASIQAYTEVANENEIEIQSYDEWLAEQSDEVPKQGDPDYEYYKTDYVKYLRDSIEEFDNERNNDYEPFRDAYFDLRLRFGKERVNNALQAVIEYEAKMEQSDYNTQMRSDSRATVFMKALGYEGIDTRGTGLDNTAYGSVIYDLKGDDLAKKNAIGTAKYSLSDSDYLAAVKRGDTDTMQRMVDDAAREWGDGKEIYTTDPETGEVLFKFYRSADGGRTVWDGHGNNKAQGVFLTSNEHIANAFDPSGEHITVYAKAENPFEIDARGENYTGIPVDENSPDWLQDIAAYEVVYDDEIGDYVDTMYVDIDNLYPAAFEQGYDAVIATNIKEGVGGGLATDVVLKDGGKQMKSADPVTYDDRGNAIPLSERFNTQSNDIRYSLAEAEISGKNHNLGIDNQQNLVYNGARGDTYARTDEFRRLQEESQRMSDEEWHFYLRGGENEVVRRRVATVLQRQIDTWHRSGGFNNGRLTLSGKNSQFNIYEGVDASLFHDVFEITRKYLKNGELVDLHEIETTEDGIGYNDCYNYLSEDGLSGFSITPDGDLISVFNASDKGGFLRAISSIVKEKAKTLDCYASPEQNLMGMYERFLGFKAASVMDYNMEYDHDNIAENHGMPQIAFMVNTEADVETKSFNKDQYDEAVEYRNSFVNQATSDKVASFMPKNADVKYSLSADNEGRDLSPAVKKRFANSKVVDENGDLKVVYHGTATGEFSIFDKSKGSVEGDFGSGFYFTDNDTDVSEHYEGGGPDFDNKVGRRADEIWGEEDDIEYEEAERRAREELYKGAHKFEVYLNIENPAIVGETQLLTQDKYLEEYDPEDYDNEDDYYGDVEQLVADDIDGIIWEIERNVDVSNTDGIAGVLYDAYYNGGIGIEELKSKINELYLEDSNGNMIGNEVTRQIIESLGYDGIIDPTVSGKWNMDIEPGTNHYIVFKPNQIKAVTNQNPTDNPDIHKSLSAEGTTPKQYGNWNIRGEDVALAPTQEEVAPVADTAAEVAPEVAPEAAPTVDNVVDNSVDEAVADNETTSSEMEKVAPIKEVPVNLKKRRPSRAALAKFTKKQSYSGGFKLQGAYNAEGKQYISDGNFVAEFNSVDENIPHNKDFPIAKLQNFLNGAVESQSEEKYSVELDKIIEINKAGKGDKNNKVVVTVGGVPFDGKYIEAVMRAIPDATLALGGYRGGIKTLVAVGSNGTAMVMPLRAGDNLTVAYEAQEIKVAPENFAPTTAEDATAAREASTPSLNDADAPSEVEAPYYEASTATKSDDPFNERDYKGVGNRKVKAYMSENPEVRPYFQQAAQAMLGDLQNSTKGERFYNDETYSESGGESGWGGTKRHTTDDIAYLLDRGYSYAEIEKGLNAIIQDHGAENIAVAKRIEFALNDRLRNGYTDIYGEEIPPNEEYLKLFSKKQAAEAIYNEVPIPTDADAPIAEPAEDIAPIAPVAEKYEAIRPQKEQTQEAEPRMRRADNPNKAPAGSEERSWVETSTGSEAVDNLVTPDDIPDEVRYYQVKSNKKTLEAANRRLAKDGYAKSREYFEGRMSERKLTVEDIALGERLIQEAAKAGDAKAVRDLIIDVSILGTELGQRVQALSMIRRLTPEGQLKALVRTVERGKAKGDKAFDGVEVTEDMTKRILDTKKEDGTFDQAELNEAVEDVKQQIADQMPTGVMDYVNAWRYLSMLGNPKTHIRNVVSNVAMFGTRAVKNAIARTIEDIAPIKNKTKTWRRATDAVKDFAKKTTNEMKTAIQGDTKYSEEGSIKAKRQIFKTKAGNAINNLNQDALEGEDYFFSRPAFELTFREYLTANGIKTEADIKNNPELIEKAKDYALEEAKRATFRQDSYLADKIKEIENKNPALGMAVGSIMPFKKTPINIAKTGVAYSPLGFARNVYDAVKVAKGEMDASEAVDHLAQTLTGTSLTLIGFALASAGMLNGAGEDDKEGKYDYQLGEQSYSFNFGGDTYSLSWLSPVAMPLFVGANAYEKLVEKEDWDANVVVDTLAQTLDPLSEMSFLSSLDDVLSSYDSGVEKIWGAGESMVQNYATQFVPTLSSQVAQTFDDTKRSTKASRDSGFKFGEETLNKIKYKIPGLRNTLEPTTDIWGNDVKQTENFFQRGFESFLSPANKREGITTEVDEEIKDLYRQTGKSEVIPAIPSDYINYDGVKHDMSAEDYTEYKHTYGQTAHDLLEQLFDTDTYKSASSEERADMVRRVYDYARDNAKKEYFDKLDLEYTNAQEDNEEVFKENSIKGAIEADLPVDEYEFSVEYPEKYKFFKDNDMYQSYKAADEDGKRAYNWAYDNPGKYTMSKAVADDFLTFYQLRSEMNDFDAKDANGETVSGLKKERVTEYINGLDLDYGQKIILYRSMYDSKEDRANYNYDIIEYLNSRDDISYEEMETILKELGFTVDSNGNISWD